MKPGGPGPGCRPSGFCLPHSVRLNSLHTPFILISDCRVSSWASWHLWPGIQVSPIPSSQGLSTELLLLAPSAECPGREEQRPRSSRRGSGRVNTGQMLQSLFRDPVYWSKGFHLENMRHAMLGPKSCLSAAGLGPGLRDEPLQSLARWGILTCVFTMCRTQVGPRMHGPSLYGDWSSVLSPPTRSSICQFFPHNVRATDVVSVGCQLIKVVHKAGCPESLAGP